MSPEPVKYLVNCPFKGDDSDPPLFGKWLTETVKLRVESVSVFTASDQDGCWGEGGLSLPLSCLAVRLPAPMMHGTVTAPRCLQEVEHFLGGAGHSESALRKNLCHRQSAARLLAVSLLYQTLPVLRASVQEVCSH